MKNIILGTFLLVTVYAIYPEGERESEYKQVNLVWTANVPIDSVYSKGMTIFKNYVETNSSIDVNIYTAGENINDTAAEDACIEGIIDITYFDSSYFEDKIPYIEMLNSAFLFRDYEHMAKVLNSEIGEKIFTEVAEEYGVRPIGSFYLGARQLNLVESAGEVRTPYDMKNVRVSCRSDPFSMAMIKAMGGIPVPYTDFTEIYNAIRKRNSDAQNNELLLLRKGRFHELTKYIILTNHVIKTVWPCINEAKWQSLNKSQQEIVTEAVKNAGTVCADYILRQEQSALDYFRGIEFIIIEDIDRKAFSDFAYDYYSNDPVAADWDMQLFREIQNIR